MALDRCAGPGVTYHPEGAVVVAWWRRRALLRGMVGVFAGQLLALQFLLAGIIATQMAAAQPADPFAICFGGHAAFDSSGQADPQRTTHPQHTTCVVCAFASHAPPIAADVSQLVAAPVGATPIALPATALAVDRAGRYGPRLSQGPPLNA